MIKEVWELTIWDPKKSDYQNLCDVVLKVENWELLVSMAEAALKNDYSVSICMIKEKI